MRTVILPRGIIPILVASRLGIGMLLAVPIWGESADSSATMAEARTRAPSSVQDDSAEQMGASGANDASAWQAGAADFLVFIPLLLVPPDALDFTINSPAAGIVSGMMYFSIQPGPDQQISSVHFQAGARDLGTDSRPEDGFKVFLDGDSLPAGPIRLVATASGPGGKAIRRLEVIVEPNPSSEGEAGPDGLTLETEIGSNITIPPGGVAAGTRVTVTEESQTETTREHGIDWERLGVTFLGAQEVGSGVPIERPLMVASAGYGNRVQPGQVVVNYQLVPDVDGDGMDEIVVLNTASVAPNDDVISDPVPDVVVPAAVVAAASGLAGQSVSQALTLTPGALLQVPASGLNVTSVTATEATWHSGVDARVYRTVAVVLPGAAGTNQTATVVVPPLSPGSASLTLKNLGTTNAAPGIAVTIGSAPAPSDAGQVVVQRFLTDTITFLHGRTVRDEESNAIERAVARLTDAHEGLAALEAAGLTPAMRQALDEAAVVIANLDGYVLAERKWRQAVLMRDLMASLAAVWSVVDRQLAAAPALAAVRDDLFVAQTQLAVAYIGCTLQSGGGCLGDSAPVAPSAAHPASEANCDSMADPCTLRSAGVLTATGTIIPDCQTPAGTPASYRGGQPGGLRWLVTGMGGIRPPPGGEGCGNIVLAVPPTSQGNTQEQFSVKIYPRGVNQGSPLAVFTGFADASGYFYVPVIPAGEQFTAIARNTVTGEFQTFDGVGPLTGQAIYMSFDFSGGTGTDKVVGWDGGGDNASWHDPLNWNTDTLPRFSDRVIIDVPGTVTVTHSVSATLIASLHTAEPLRITGGVLDLAGASVFSNTLRLSGGALFADATVTVNGLLRWTGGGMGGTGKTVATGGLWITGTRNERDTLDGRILENAGKGTLDGPGLFLRNGAVINNLPGATFELKSDALLASVDPTLARFNNAGTFVKSAGSGVAAFQYGLFFNNTGSVKVRAGTLGLGDGVNRGTIDIGASETVDIDGTFENATTGDIRGSGTLDIHDSNFTNNGTIQPTVRVRR